jgi:hypothetical protein
MFKIILTSTIIILQVINSAGVQPIIKVDLNYYSRQESEVNEPGYIPWPISPNTSVSKTFGSVEITFKGDGFSSDWYKAGIQTPYYARLASDGLIAGKVEMHISGLSEGRHTLLTYHNTFISSESNTFSPINIYVDGIKVIDNLMPSNRATKISDVPTAYIQLNALVNKEIVVLLEPVDTSTASWKNVSICGFEINTPNVALQAINPYPAHNDEHVDADIKNLKLRWQANTSAVNHDVYFGTDYSAVLEADRNSNIFLGNQKDTFYVVTNLNCLLKYYWRIDEIDTAGKINKGSIWYFRPRQLSFPGAEGYGKYAIGGRGGKVVEVTNLNDDGPGSLREAITIDIGPRTIVFAVSGLITLNSRLVITQPFITVAGQTAPGKGICIRKAPFGMSGANDVIIRHVRVRLGSGTTYDGMGMAGSDYCIIDHSSISWTIDEAFSSRNAKNITLQRTLISEALNVAGHQNYPAGTKHGYAASISGDIGSFHHNLLAHCYGRNWSLAGGLDGNGIYMGRLDIFNNVVYNWGGRPTDGGAHEVNFVSNYYKPGPATSTKYVLNAQYDGFPGTQQYYFTGNISPGVFDESNQEAGRKYSGTPGDYSPWVDSAFFPSFAEIQTAGDAYKNVLSDVGCTQPVFDDHDIRIINETSNGSYTYRGSASGLKGLPDTDKDVGSWEDYPALQRNEKWDSDHDGMPDWWENTKGLNPNSESGDYNESSSDPDSDGYTNLEDYLNWMADPHFFTDSNKVVEIDLGSLTRGFTDKPVYKLMENLNGKVIISQENKFLLFTPDKRGLASVTFLVEDASGSSMIRKIGIYNGPLPKDSILTGNINQKKTQVFNVNCFPNPVYNNLSISIYLEKTSLTRIKITNVLGNKVLANNFQISAGEFTYHQDVSKLVAGIYFITVITNDKQKTIRFLKH